MSEQKDLKRYVINKPRCVFHDGLPCLNCGSNKNSTDHHLVPRSKSKKKKVRIAAKEKMCEPCHRHLHAMFKNSYIKKYLNTALKIRRNPMMQEFATWRIAHPNTITHSKERKRKKW